VVRFAENLRGWISECFPAGMVMEVNATRDFVRDE